MSEQPRKVCVLGEGEYSGWCVLGVFDSKWLAEEYILDYLHPLHVTEMRRLDEHYRRSPRTPPTFKDYVSGMNFSFDVHDLHEVPGSWLALQGVRGVR